MTARELIEKLKLVPPDTEVKIEWWDPACCGGNEDCGEYAQLERDPILCVRYNGLIAIIEKENVR